MRTSHKQGHYDSASAAMNWGHRGCDDDASQGPSDEFRREYEEQCREEAEREYQKQCRGSVGASSGLPQGKAVSPVAHSLPASSIAPHSRPAPMPASHSCDDDDGEGPSDEFRREYEKQCQEEAEREYKKQCQRGAGTSSGSPAVLPFPRSMNAPIRVPQSVSPPVPVSHNMATSSIDPGAKVDSQGRAAHDPCGGKRRLLNKRTRPQGYPTKEDMDAKDILKAAMPAETQGPSSAAKEPEARVDPQTDAAHDTRGCKRRLVGEQTRPLGGLTKVDMDMKEILRAAVAAEDEEPSMLAATVKRKHVHWTHVRTWCADHKQPSEFSREEFWLHMERCYREVYPDKRSSTGSILAFGVVVKEHHKDSSNPAQRDEHHHCPTFNTAQHYWNKVAKHSLAKYGVVLNAVAHDSYASMYAYVRVATKKKPFLELDAEPYLSPAHPRGGALVELLSCARWSQRLLQTRGSVAQKRPKLSVFEEIQKNDLCDAEALQAHACREAQAGRTGLAEYCTRQGYKLDEVVRGARAVMDAPAKLEASKMTLLDKLIKAARDLPCECQGRWEAGATRVLQHNNIPVPVFCRAVRSALRVGAKRGANVACVGPAGCGKSTLLESLEKIFTCAGKPEQGSTFPLSSIVGCEVILWQDYEHDEKTIRFTDLLCLFVGESVGVRIPGSKNGKYRNRAPTFYSGRKPMRLRPSRVHDFDTAEEYSGMMDERFTFFYFTQPLPMNERIMEFAHCGRCAARFYVSDAAGVPPATPVVPMGPPEPKIPAQLVSNTDSQGHPLVQTLRDLHELRVAGALTPEEFDRAKAQLLSGSSRP